MKTDSTLPAIVSVDGQELPLMTTGQKLVQFHLLPIAHFFNTEGVTSIGCNQYNRIFIRKFGNWELTDARFESEELFVDAIKQILYQLGQNIDSLTQPIADGRIPDGSRVNAVLSPVAHPGSNMTIRLFPKVRYSVEDLLSKGVMSEEMRDFFGLAVRCEYNIGISGPTGSGKTTILNALANLSPDEHRLGVIEDTAELNISKPNMVSMEAPKRSLTIDGFKTGITMENLLVNVLRQELASVAVGEIRDPAAATALMLALNTGHRGVKSTGHANSALSYLKRVINLLLSNDSRIPYDAVKNEIFDNFNLIVQCEHTPRHGKRITEVAELNNGDLNMLYVWDYLEGKHKKVFTKRPRLHEYALRYGIDMEH